MRGKGIHGLLVLQTGWFGLCGRSKFSSDNIALIEPELTPPSTTMTPKPWLENHLNSLDTPNA
jgi:hypothetical protein